MAVSDVVLVTDCWLLSLDSFADTACYVAGFCRMNVNRV